MIFVCHLVVGASSQWVIGRSLTEKSDVLHAGRNAIHIVQDDIVDYILIVNCGRISYNPRKKFGIRNDKTKALPLSYLSEKALENKPWSKVKAIVKEVFHHVYGHETFTNFELFFERIKL